LPFDSNIEAIFYLSSFANIDATALALHNKAPTRTSNLANFFIRLPFPTKLDIAIMTLSSLEPLFNPQSMAIIGASEDPNKLGGRPVHFMKEGPYTGRMYPINAKNEKVQGLRAYKNIKELPEVVDLAVIVVPAPFVLQAVKDCAEMGVRSVVIISSGFAEIDEQGAGWQQEIVDVAAAVNMRVVGPNCMGMINTTSRAVGTFSTMFHLGWPKVGKISILSQSGAVGGHMLVMARERGLGVQSWMTTGNECDIDVAQSIEYCANDEETEVIIAYMEGCKSPETLKRALATAQRRRKPVVIMKVGASDVGTIAANTHTASLTGADAVYDAIFRQYGVHRAHSLDEMIAVGAACATGALPASRRLGIVTISGGVGVLSADAAEANGLEVPALPEAAQKRLKDLMPLAAVRNPVDTTAQMLTDTELMRKNLEVMIDEGNCDTIMVFMSTLGINLPMMDLCLPIFEDMADRDPSKLLVTAMLTHPDVQAKLESHGYLAIEDPSRAIEIISAMAKIRESFDRADNAAPAALPENAILPPNKVVGEYEAARILASAGLPMAPGLIATSGDDAVAAAVDMGFPVVMKVASADIQHKSDIGGVKLNLADGEAVRAAFDTIMANADKAMPAAKIDGILVAPMIQGGVETIMGVSRDPVFGPVVLFGLGGVFVEVLKDVSFRAAPFGVDEAHRMIDELKGRDMLDGVRGAPAADIDALAESLSQLSVYAAAHKDRIESIDINPVLALEKGKGVVGVDAVIVPHQAD